MTPQEWLIDCYNPLSTRSSTDKLKEAHRIIRELLKIVHRYDCDILGELNKPPQDKF